MSAMTSHRVDVAALARLLDEREMSKRDLQRATGLSWSFIKYLVKGERNLSPTSARIVAAALSAAIADFTVDLDALHETAA